MKSIDYGPSGSRAFDAILWLRDTHFPRFVHFFFRNQSDPQLDLVKKFLHTLMLQSHYSCVG